MFICKMRKRMKRRALKLNISYDSLRHQFANVNRYSFILPIQLRRRLVVWKINWFTEGNERLHKVMPLSFRQIERPPFTYIL